jgi:hypothetical protein
MFCTGCGSPINSHEHFCHHCGKQLSSANGGHPPYRQKTAPWVIFTGLAVLALFFYMTWAGAQYGDLEKPARKQLETIKEGKIPEAYYEYTSKQFQAATSLEQFRQFVKSHGIITSYKDFSFNEPVIDDKRGVLTGTLTGAEGAKTDVKFFLFRQDDEWKIDSLQIVDSAQEVVDAKALDPKEKDAILNPIEDQLQDLKRGDVDDAYKDVSEGFKKVTSRDQFAEFIKQYDVLANYRSFNVLEQMRQGDRAAVKIELVDQKGKTPIEYYLIKENDAWKIWSLQVLMPTEAMPPPSLMTEPVQAQLEALKNNQPEQAYNDYTSDEFKKITSLDTFKNFMVNFPLFTNYASIDYKKPRVEEAGGKLLVVLKGADGQTATVEYTLGVSEGKWKIWGLRLVDFDQPEQKEETQQEKSDLESSTLESIAKDQLYAITSNDYQKAYDQYTSPEFREATNFETFTRFLNAYPIFAKHDSIKFGKLTVENNVATIKGTLQGADNRLYAVDYDFIKNNDQWKILRIQLVAAEAETKSSYFGSINMGNEVTASGDISKPTTIFTDPSKNIYANIFVNGSQGDVVTVTFRHNNSQSAIKPVASSPLPKDGEFRTSFSFTPPPQGWPKGDYQLELNASNGQQSTYPFKVE